MSRRVEPVASSTVEEERDLLARDRALLALRGLGHAFGRRTVLEGLDLEVQRGSIVGLLGPNGSGKSTALALVAGLLPIRQGSVTFDGEELHRGGARGRARVGVVFQQPSLDEKLTGKQNLSLYAQIHGIGGAAGAHRGVAEADAVGLGGRLHDAVRTYSGGMKRRLDIARALLPEPELLLMDEPTAGLDEHSFRQLWARLEELRRTRRLTILLATHRPDEAERCDRLAILKDGKVLLQDSPEALRRQVARDAVVVRPVVDDIAALRDEMVGRFDIPGRVDGDTIVLEHEAGHELIPRLVEAYPEGKLASVALRRPTVADVFLKLTGQSLEADLEAPHRPGGAR